jgi:predicted peroxiredoxin
MSKRKLGILVNTDKNLEHILGICEAAKKAGVKVSIFIMDDGCYLTKKPELLALGKKGVNIAMCDHSYREKGFTEALAEVKHGSQFDHALIAHECDRYVVL